MRADQKLEHTKDKWNEGDSVSCYKTEVGIGKEDNIHGGQTSLSREREPAGKVLQEKEKSGRNFGTVGTPFPAPMGRRTSSPTQGRAYRKNKCTYINNKGKMFYEQKYNL